MNILKRTLAGLLVVFLAFGQVTSIPGTVDAVMGFSNLTTVGAIPYVSASGTLSQDADLSWNSANNRALIGIETGATNSSTRLTLVGDTNPYTLAFKTAGSGTNFYLGADTAGTGITFSNNAGTAVARVINSTGSFGIGPSNTSPTGTLHVYDATATTGVTTLTVRAGAGQSGSSLQEWMNTGGTVLARINSAGWMIVPIAQQATSSPTWLIDGSGYSIRSTSVVRWSNGVAADGTSDLGLARDAAGRLRVSDGSTGLGQIMIASATPASAAATCAAGTVVWDSGFVYVCVATDTWKRAAIATW